MLRQLFQRCTYFLCCSVLSLGCKVNRTRRMSQPDMGSIFHIKKSIKYSAGKRNYDVNYQNYQNEMLLSSSSTIRGTLLHQIFQYVRREYAKAINVPCLITLYLYIRYSIVHESTDIYLSGTVYIVHESIPIYLSRTVEYVRVHLSLSLRYSIVHESTPIYLSITVNEEV